MTAVPGWRGDSDQLAALPVPAELAAARLDNVVSLARTASATARERAGEELSARDEVAARLATLTAGGALPDQTTLARARAHRDRGWALLFARLSGNPAPDAEQAYAPGHPVALAFERAIRDADAIADRRVDETHRLTMAAELGASPGPRGSGPRGSGRAVGQHGGRPHRRARRLGCGRRPGRPCRRCHPGRIAGVADRAGYRAGSPLRRL